MRLVAETALALHRKEQFPSDRQANLAFRLCPGTDVRRTWVPRCAALEEWRERVCDSVQEALSARSERAPLPTRKRPIGGRPKPSCGRQPKRRRVPDALDEGASASIIIARLRACRARLAVPRPPRPQSVGRHVKSCRSKKSLKLNPGRTLYSSGRAWIHEQRGGG